MPKVFALLILLGQASAMELSLAEAVQYMQSGNQGLKAGEQRQEAAHLASQAARGNYLPVVKLELVAEHLDRDLVLDLDPIREAMLQLHSNDALNQQILANQMQNGPVLSEQQKIQIQQGAYARLDQAIPHFRDTVKQQNHWLGNISVYQPLFHGGRIVAANSILQAKSKVARQENVRKNLDIHRDLSKLYIQASLLQSSIRLRKSALEAMESHSARAKSLHEQGMVDRTALLRAQIAIADGQTALADDKMKLQSIALTLAQFLGIKDPIYPLDSLFGLPPELEMERAKVQEIPESHPIVTILQAQQELAEKSIAIKNADFVPEIGAFGKYELNQSALSSLEPNWIVGVKGSIVLFRGGSDYYQRASAIATKREIQWMKAEVKSSLEAQFQRQILNLQQYRLRYQNQAIQEELARENHRFTLRRFEEGQATGLEVIDAWLTLQKVQLERISSAGEAWNAVLEIQWSLGNTTDFVQLWNGVNSK